MDTITHIYVATFYENDSYAFNGISVFDATYHRTREGAERAIAERGWTLVDVPTRGGHATVETAELED